MTEAEASRGNVDIAGGFYGSRLIRFLYDENVCRSTERAGIANRLHRSS
jgi:hypothetical protein